MEIVEKSKVGLSPDSHNAWKPAQNAGFHIPPATVAASTIKANAAEPLESRGFTDSRAEPKKLDPKKFVRIHRSTVVSLAWIKEVTSLPGGFLNIRLKDARNTDLTVARDRAREFKTRIGY